MPRRACGRASTIEPGWEDALEAVLRERLNGIALDDIGRAAEWLRGRAAGQDDGRRSERRARCAGRHRSRRRSSRCSATSRAATPRLEPVLREWLHQVYVVRRRAQAALALRAPLPAGAVLVTREGHIYTRHSVSFHAPDSELHGVLSRQREIEELEASSRPSAHAVPAAQSEVAAAEAAIDAAQGASSPSCARRVARDAAAPPRAADRSAAAVRAGAAAHAARRADRARARRDRGARRDRDGAARGSRRANRARLERESAEAREAARARDRALPPRRLGAHAAARSAAARRSTRTRKRCSRRAARRGEDRARPRARSGVLTEQTAALAASARGGGGSARGAATKRQWQDAAPAGARRCAASASRRSRRRATRSKAWRRSCKELEQERLAAEQRLEPLRERINEVRLKEQEARLTEEQYAQQLVEVGRGRSSARRALLEKGTRSGALQAEITRLNEEIKALGAVNLAALEELQTATGAQDLSRRAVAGPDRGDDDARRRDPAHRPRDARAAAGDVRRGERALQRDVPGALRRRPGEARADRRGDPRRRRAGDRAAAGQEEQRRSICSRAARRRSPRSRSCSRCSS